MSSVVMLLSNPFRPDPRVEREASILTQAGYQVTILAWDRKAEFPAEQITGGYRIQRIHSVRSAYGAGARQLARIPRFWRRAVQLAEQIPIDVIHCHDLDTLPAGWWLKRSRRARLVFDAHEDYPALMSLYLPRVFVRLLGLLEKSLLAHPDLTITASTVLAEKYRQMRIEPVLPLGNVPRLEPFQSLSQDQIAAARRELGLVPDDFVVAYIGGFSRNRLLLPLIQSAPRLPQVKFLLWGDGHQRSDVEKAVKNLPNVSYLGWLELSQVPLYTRLADVIYYCLQPDYPGAVYNAPNTLSYAMAAGRPILCNNVGDLGRIVGSQGCGLLLDQVTSETIAQALTRLQDPALRRQLGEAGLLAAANQYNWDKAAQDLLLAYEGMLHTGKA